MDSDTLQSRVIHQRRRWLAGFLPLLLALPTPSQAQTVRGQLLETGIGQPLDGALVLLLDLAGNQIDGSLTNEAGRFLLRATEPGRYRVRAERIGFATVISDPLDLSAGQAFQIQLYAAQKAIELEGITVEGEKECVLRPEEGVVLAQVWDEARKALTAQDWSDRKGLNRFEVMSYERELDPQTRLAVSESRRTDELLTRNPIRSLPAEDLLADGFIRRDQSGAFTYYGPDAQVLLSDAFLDTHCFALKSDPGRTDMLGLSFKPARRTSVPEIVGTLWLDSKTARLRFLEFGYTWSPWPEASGTAEGRVHFEEMPNGSWIVRRWWIRMPMVIQNPTLMSGGGSGFRVARIKEAGGEVGRISPLDEMAPLGRGREGRGILSGLVWDSLRAVPLTNAQVYLSGTHYSAVTNSVGSFLLVDLPPGMYQVSFTHPQLDSLGVYPQGVEVSIADGETANVALAFPSRFSLLQALCSEAGWEPETSAVVGMVRDARTGTPLPGATVALEWTNYRVVANREILANVERIEVTTDQRGRYRACGIPSLVILSAQVTFRDVKGPVVKAMVPEERAMVFDLTLNPIR